jgi:ferredoxin-nitrite reductase
MNEFDDQQKQWLQGFVSGLEARKAADRLTNRSAAAAAAPSNAADALQAAAQDRVLAAGGKLVAEETAKRQRHPLDRMDEVEGRARAGQFPKGIDVFLTKYQGLFYVAPAQDSFMCRLRIPNGILAAWQVRGLADAADAYGGGYADVTTRANLQIREIAAADAIKLLEAVQALGLTSRGSGADNIRNITGGATAGIDPQELIDTRPLASAMHHYILNRREMYGLPRKFNIAFDGGGRVPTLEDTNDIGFVACRVTGGALEPGVYFRLQLGGITGHLDFAFETGILLKPDECVSVAGAVVRAFIAHGDRTNRQKARLKYVVDRMGRDAFIAEVEKEYGQPLRRAAGAEIAPRPLADKGGHIGVHRQKQAGRSYIGLVLPVGRLTSEQMRGLAEISERFGSGTIRLTVWQNLLISDVADRDVGICIAAINALGLGVEASAIRRGLVACTGNAGCKFAAANTKGHALRLADHLEARVPVDLPVNIHLTGCHHSCAQHYVGDIGLLAAKVDRGEDSVEGYHVYIGGGAASTAEQAMAREYAKSVAFDDLPPMIERLLAAWLAHRASPAESFFEFARRHEVAALRELADRASPSTVAA